MYHVCKTTITAPIQTYLSPENVLTFTRGWWPNLPGTEPPIELKQGVDLALEADDAYVYISRVGDIIVSADFLPYGQTPEGDAPLLDVVAWREGDGWHVKQLIKE